MYAPAEARISCEGGPFTFSLELEPILTPFLPFLQILKAPPASAYLSDFRHGRLTDAPEPASGPAEAPGKASAPAKGPSELDRTALGPLEAALLLPPSEHGALAGFGLRPPDSDAGLSSSATIGIVLAALFLLAIITVVFAMVLRGPAARRAARHRAANAQNGAAAKTKEAAVAADEHSGADTGSSLDTEATDNRQGSSGPDRQGSSGPEDAFVFTRE